MDMVRRYIAAVQRALPEAKRDEIGRELQANIMDELDAISARQGQLTAEDISQVLKQMGPPQQVAREFVPLQPLINASYMPVYSHTLRLVLGILFLLQVVQSAFAWIAKPDANVLNFLFDLAGGYLADVCFAFTAVTLAFYMIARQKPEFASAAAKNWQPETLPPAGFAWQSIALDDIITDLASYLFLLVVVFYPLWQGNIASEHSGLQLSAEARAVLIWCTPLLVAAIGNSLWQLQQRLWHASLLRLNILINALLAVVLCYLAALSPLLTLSEQLWYGFISLAQLERTVTVSLIVLAFFPAWEALRDGWRLRQLTPKPIKTDLNR